MAAEAIQVGPSFDFRRDAGAAWNGPGQEHIVNLSRPPGPNRHGPQDAPGMTAGPEPNGGVILGIDLGTTHAVVAVADQGGARVLPNQEGNNRTPCVVALNEAGEWLVGEPALRQAAANPAHTLSSFKRLLGRLVGEVPAFADRPWYPPGRERAAPARVCVGGQELAPQQLAALVLRKLKEAAEAHLGHAVRRAVLTVPASFGTAGRQAVLDAARIAGLATEWDIEDPVSRKIHRMGMRLLHGPTATALAYAAGRMAIERVAVIHLGGGTFDVSILDSGQGVVQVEAVKGESDLGGDDFDQALVDYLAGEFNKGHGIDLRKDPMALQRLREAAERAKKDLSQAQTTDVNLPFIASNADGRKNLHLGLTRTRFEQLVSHLVEKCRGLVMQALADARLKPGEVNVVVLVGGMARMPGVQQGVRELFGSRTTIRLLPEETVALGAAIQGAQILQGSQSELLLVDAAPLSLGVRGGGGRLRRLIGRNTSIPCERKQIFSTSTDNQTTMAISIYEGEAEMASSPANRLLGQFRFEGIPPAPRGVPRIELTFSLDKNGGLMITARDLGTGHSQTVQLFVSGGLSVAEVERLYREGEQERLIRAQFGACGFGRA
jgi:molecular chaperone DnaK